MNRYREKGRAEYADLAEVTLANEKVVNLAGHTGLRNVRMVMPYGIRTVPVEGGEVVILPLENGEYVMLGCVDKGSEQVDSGEILLKSRGGATLKLKNNGEVEINGRIISASGDFGEGSGLNG